MLIPFQPPPGLVSNDTNFASPGRYSDADGVRFYQDTWQTQGGWESLTTTLLTGVCRCVFPWTDNSSVMNIAFGTHSNLQLWQGGTVYDITPTKALPSAKLAANPITTSVGTPTITVAQPGHSFVVGDSNTITGASAVSTVTINGTWTVTAVTTDTWTFTAGSNAAGTVTGGGSAVVVTPQRAYAAGAIDGTGGAGYSTGSYGSGTWSSPSTADFFPRTWWCSAFGQTLIANYRNGPIYQWTNATGTPAAPLANSPAKVNFALVVPQRQVMAFGCNDETTGVFNPLNIRWSDIEDPTVWATLSTNNAGGYLLEGGGRIVAARVVGDYVFIWTDTALWLAQYIGDPGETWRFTKAGPGGLIGPLAPVVVGTTAYWISPDIQFYTCGVGGTPTPIDCTIRKDFADNIAASQADKIVGASISMFREIRWFYPDARDGYENSRDITISPGPVWCRGRLARTAFVDAGPTVSPLGVTYGGNVYYHERGSSADGSALSWFIESTDFYLDEDAAGLMINGVWPNFKNQSGGISLTLYMRERPQATERTHGPFVLLVGAERKSFRCTGRIARIRLEGSSSPAYARMGKLEFDVEQIGGR